MTALIVVDMQNDFMPGGSLGVKGADEIVLPILGLMQKFPHRIATLDWHPKNHCSFAVNHPAKKVGDTIEIKGHSQRLWPVHCVQNSPGAKFTKGFSEDQFNMIFRKGSDPTIDSYSTFYDNGHKKSTGLTDYLHKHHITHVTFVGLTFDYCIFYSALDARRDGFKVTVIPALSRAIDTSDIKQQETLKLLRLYGVVLDISMPPQVM
jgi:nicotinamidase/pyrazinamidase